MMEQQICKRIIYSHTGQSPQKNPHRGSFHFATLGGAFLPCLGSPDYSLNSVKFVGFELKHLNVNSLYWGSLKLVAHTVLRMCVVRSW